MTAAKPDKTRSSAIRLNRSRKGEIGTALARSLAEARQAGRIPAHSVVVALAERMAGVADAAWRADDERAFMTASQKLMVLMRALGLVDSSVPIGGEDGDSSDDRGRDPIDAELAGIVGSGPALRHSKDT